MRRMKHRTIILSLVTGLLLTLSCSQEPERILYKGPDFVFLDTENAQVSLYENQKTPLIIHVKVSMAQSTNTKVGFEVVGENVLANSDYIVNTSSPVEISHSKYSADIAIQPIDNAVIQPETRIIRVRIKSIDNP